MSVSTTIYTTRDQVKAYLDAGLRPIPIPVREKKPSIKGWTNLKVTPDNIDEYFGTEPQNVGLLLGCQTNTIADVDCDSLESIIVAGELLTKTDAVFGRESRPNSHYLYKVEALSPTKKFVDPLDNSSIIEFRCAKNNGEVGSQTVVPPSIHPSGENVEWTDSEQNPELIRQPTPTDGAQLLKVVSKAAAAAVLAKYWPKAGDGRHECMLALAGALANASWQEDEALLFCRVVYGAITEPDIQKGFPRIESEVATTFQRHQNETAHTGLRRLKEFIDPQVVKSAAAWLDLKREPLIQEAVEHDARPVVQLANRSLDKKTDDCIRALAATNTPPTLFIHNNGPILINPKDGSVRELNEVLMTSILSRTVDFVKNNTRCDPSDRVVRDVLVRLPFGDEFPKLDSVVHAPTIRQDGTILELPGYDVQSGIFYAPEGDLYLPPIPSEPTQQEILSAVATVNDVIFDFPFVDESCKANFIAAMLTPILRPAINGPTPMALFDAPSTGTGKSLLAEVVSIIATGRDAFMMPAPTDANEWRKTLVSVLRSGSPLVIFDNVEKRLQSSELCSVLTSQVWTSRLLGQNSTPPLSVRCSWFCTANNVQLEVQMARRVYGVRIDAKIPKPSKRTGFKYPDLRAHVRASRGQLIAALLTMARAWFSSGCPKPKAHMASFEEWARVIGGVLEVCGVQGFLENGDELYKQADQETQHWESLLVCLAKVTGKLPFTTKQIAIWMDMDKPIYQELKDAVENVFGDAASDKARLKQRLAKSLNEKLGRRFGDEKNQIWLEHAGSAQHAIRWQICTEGMRDRTARVVTMPSEAMGSESAA